MTIPGHETGACAATVFSGCFCAVGSALCKQHGVGSRPYYLKWQWWTSFGVQALGGIIGAMVLPYLDTRVFVPLQLTTEMLMAVLLGSALFCEPIPSRSYAGLALAASGTALLSVQKPEGVPAWSLERDYWASYLGSTFVVCNGAFSVALCAAWLMLRIARPSLMSLLAAHCSALAFCQTRALSTALQVQAGAAVQTPAVYFATGLNAVLSLASTDLQQRMLAGELSVVKPLFCGALTVLQCSAGAGFFNEPTMFATVPALLSSGVALAGLGLLATANKTSKKA